MIINLIIQRNVDLIIQIIQENEEIQIKNPNIMIHIIIVIIIIVIIMIIIMVHHDNTNQNHQEIITIIMIITIIIVIMMIIVIIIINQIRIQKINIINQKEVQVHFVEIEVDAHQITIEVILNIKE